MKKHEARATSSRTGLGWALAALVAGAAACADATGPQHTTLDEMVGNYTATSAVFAATADEATSHDVLAAGETYILQIHPGGQYTTTLERPGSTHVVRTGMLEMEGSRLTATETGGTPRLIEFALDGDVLTWNDMADRFDFGAGDAPARFTATLVR